MNSSISRKWPRFARDPRRIQTILGAILDEIYVLDSSPTGNLVGRIAGSVLTAFGTPTTRNPVGTSKRPGISYDTYGDRHYSTNHGIGTGSGYYAVVGEYVTSTGLPGLIQKIDGVAANSFSMYCQGTGFDYPSAWFKQAGNQTILGNAPSVLGTTFFAQLQADRSSNTGRMRWSFGKGVAARSYSGSIAAVGDMTGTGQFSLGASAAHTDGMALALALISTGTKCEGANFLETMAKRLGYE